MLKYIIYILVAAVVIGLLIGGAHLLRVKLKNKKELTKYSGPRVEVNNNFGRVLVVYYSLSGNTRDIAQNIKAKTNADIYEIKTVPPMVSGRQMYMDVRNQLKTGKYPEIEKDIPNMENYDLIFVGAPVWWYTAATPVLSFLETVDFKGKKVVPFSTQGSNYGKFFEDFNAKAKNAKILQSANFNNLHGKYTQEQDNKISVWLNNLEK
ncbi:flavodoxin [Elusimicrobium posterum]|uniref:flavodoxin n=1 Tax=Elusimicrobium posterum TaxID=3116653 RepID=UPI003C74C627